MITITVYGLDQYTIGHYSREHLANLTSLFETKEEIVFVASDAYVFHDGVDQNSWQALVKVDAPEKYEPMEDRIASYILKTLCEFAINIKITFEYFHSHHEYEYHNKEYPRFITDENLVNVEDGDEDEELYEGNIFKGMEEKLDEIYKEKEECHCHDHECDCDGDCECDHEEGECCCEHHKN